MDESIANKEFSMKNFDYTKLTNYNWDSEILSYIAKIHECKGRQDLYVPKAHRA
ncbi:MAG: hypothetical protein NC089_12455 [Bacteroides sp.]|nr:hypothetical protein [Bacteroides sp.]MCM1550251.1 hypothetical protein [Clostridium sp.]